LAQVTACSFGAVDYGWIIRPASAGASFALLLAKVGRSVSLLKLLHPASRVDQLLATGKERMAVIAELNMKFTRLSRAGGETVSTGGVNVGSHQISSSLAGAALFGDSTQNSLAARRLGYLGQELLV
jgi:hypothetical protein